MCAWETAICIMRQKYESSSGQCCCLSTYVSSICINTTWKNVSVVSVTDITSPLLPAEGERMEGNGQRDGERGCAMQSNWYVNPSLGWTAAQWLNAVSDFMATMHIVIHLTDVDLLDYYNMICFSKVCLLRFSGWKTVFHLPPTRLTLLLYDVKPFPVSVRELNE